MATIANGLVWIALWKKQNWRIEQYMYHVSKFEITKSCFLSDLGTVSFIQRPKNWVTRTDSSMRNLPLLLITLYHLRDEVICWWRMFVCWVMVRKCVWISLCISWFPEGIYTCNLRAIDVVLITKGLKRESVRFSKYI